MSEPAQRSLFPQIEDPKEHEIRARWRHLVGDRLPRAALERNWSITADHCFVRILLDVTLRRPWRDIVSPPAWSNTPVNQLEQAIALGEALLDRSRNIDDLNEISLKLRCRRRDSSTATTALRQFTFDALGA